MTPPKPPRTKYSTQSTITSSYEAPQSVYEDPDAPVPAVTVGSQSEVKVKPVPRPRSKIPPKSQSNNNNNNTADPGDTASDTTNAVSSQLSAYPADYERPRPVRPPPKPPLSESEPTEAVNGGNHYMTAIYEPTVTPPAVSADRIQSPPSPRPPERPPLPSIYYDRLHSKRRSKSESYADGSQTSRCSYISSMQQSPDSPDVSEEELNLSGTYSTTATDRPDRPAVPPRVWQSLPPQSRPPPPSFTPPPPPSESSESLYSVIEHRPYLDVLPEDADKMSLGAPTLRYQTGRFSSHSLTLSQETTEDTEDINGMLRWLKRVSKSDLMDLSVYGLSLEEEIRSFNQRAMNVRKALRLYNLLMMKRKESLRKIITEFISISDNLDKLQKKAKTMDIAGGTTGAVGGVTAVLGIALAPVTFGTSLIATAVGAGMVASAGGMGVHTAKANKKVVNRMTVEKLVYEYKGNIVDLEHCLCFILSGMNELRRHDIARLQRAGAQPDALKMAHLSQSVFRVTMSNDRRTPVAHTGGMSSERLLMAFSKELDQYFTEKDNQKLKKSNKSSFSGRVRLLAGNLQDELDHLNRLWELFG